MVLTYLAAINVISGLYVWFFSTFISDCIDAGYGWLPALWAFAFMCSVTYLLMRLYAYLKQRGWVR